MKYYAVRIGEVPGIYTSWEEAKKQIWRFPKATYKSFTALKDAETFMSPPGLKAATGDHRVIYTDGSCQTNRAGSGIWFGPEDPRNLSLKVPGKQTNQRAEVFAIVAALRATEGPVEIKTDSLYAVCGCTKTHKSVMNLDLFEEVWAMLVNGRDVVFTHVYGHQGEEGNEGADVLADLAATSE